MQVYPNIPLTTNTHTAETKLLIYTTALFSIFRGTYGITVAGGLDVRQDSILDYRDTVTGPRADTTNV